MSVTEARQPCGLFAERGSAEVAVELLAKHGIDGVIERPEARTHALAEGTWQVSVPGTVVARARALVSNETGA